MNRLLMAIRNDLIREGLKRIISSSPDLSIVAEAESFSDIISIIDAGDCDGVLLNLLIPYSQTLDAVHYIKRDYPHIAVIVFSRFTEREYALRMIKGGVDCYLTIDHPTHKIIDSLKKTTTGRKHVTTTYVEQLIYDAKADRVKEPHENLSDREYEVFMMIAAGAGLNEIGEKLHLSPKTVSTYRSRIMEKLHLDNNAGLTLYAVRHDLIDSSK